jgi:apolipoprotein N-acyltransferase
VAALAPAADFILNITNDAWFGNTPGPYQHFRQAQVRAVEFGLPLLRAANNGITAAVAADGRVLDGLALDAVGILDIALPLVKMAPPLGNPPRNGLVVLAFFAIWGCAALVLTRVRSN